MSGYSLKEIAVEAGVSTATVSRVLNHSTKVTESTAARVMEVVERLDYRTNALASALRRGKSNTVGIAVASISQPWYVKLIRALREALTEHGLHSVVYDLEHSDTVLLEQLRHASDMRLAGLIVATGDRVDSTEIQSAMNSLNRSVPIVLIGQKVDGAPWPTVRFDDEAATTAAVQELLSVRDKPILMVGSSERSYLSGSRIAGAHAAVRQSTQYGGASKTVFTGSSPNYASGHRIAMEHKETLRLFGSVFCVNDEIALGFCRGVIELGLSVPEDLLVLGYGDIDFLPYVTPSISSVSGDSVEASLYVIEAMLALLNGEDPPPDVVLSRSVVHRESTRVTQKT